MRKKSIPTTWPGGYVRADEEGRSTFIIRRMIGGVRYHQSTRCRTLVAAIRELERFERDPAGYEPGGPKRAEAVVFTEELGREFLEWSKTDRRITAKWLGAKRGYLAWWAEVLAGVDLRRADLTLIEDALDKSPGARAHRIAVIKHFYGWLVAKKRILRPEEDPTFRRLTVPQAKPQQWRREKSFPQEAYEAVRRHMVGVWRDGLDVLAGTGWHLTELERFASAGEVHAFRGRWDAADGPAPAAVLVCPHTKGGEMLRTAVGEDVAAAAGRVRARGALRPDTLSKAITAGWAAAEGHRLQDGGSPKTPIPEVRAGSFRHAVSTWAIDGGEDPAAVSAFLGHKSPRTTRRFYATMATPRKVPTLR
jgi:hypothetical protein